MLSHVESLVIDYTGVRFPKVLHVAGQLLRVAGREVPQHATTHDLSKVLLYDTLRRCSTKSAQNISKNVYYKKEMHGNAIAQVLLQCCIIMLNPYWISVDIQEPPTSSSDLEVRKLGEGLHST